MYVRLFKRVIDISISITGLILLLPIFIIISVIIKISSRGPILFKQKRIGKNNEIFKILKFRTMRIDTPHDCPTHLLNNADSYITYIGKFLRRTSLDEIPQLWNILIGDMSIIGPRPSLPNQTDLIYLRNQNKSSTIRPGLTGLAQISGRDEIEIHKKAELDGQYYSTLSFKNDVYIFFKTFINVLMSEGIKEGRK